MTPSTSLSMSKDLDHGQKSASVTPAADLVSSLPAPIVRLLVLLARPIAFLRIAIEVLSWKAGRKVESWMIVGAWWGICLGAGHAFKYLLPIAIFLPLLPLDRLRLPHVSQNAKPPPPPESTPAQPTTQDTLLHTLSDLHAIYALFPQSPSTRISDVYARFEGLGQTRLIRGLVIIWSTWLVLGWIVGYRALLAILGSIILLYPSPSFAQIAHILGKSLLVRRTIALLFLITFGSPPEQSIQFDLSFSVSNWVKGKWAASRRPSLALAFRPTLHGITDEKTGVKQGDDEEQAGDPIYFKFEVHENQRWWMGLDWTSALLPQERPSWCDSHLLPASPPPSFPLPSSSSITLPSPTLTDPNSKVKRTATWKWLDDDWSIVRAGPNQSASPNIPAPATFTSQPNPQATEGYNIASSPTRPTTSQFGHSPDDSTLGPTARAQSIAEQAFTKGLERLKARTVVPSTTANKVASPRSSVEISRGRSESQTSDDLHMIGEGSGIGQGGSVGAIGTGEIICERDEATDGDGWVYGDNKWEGMGPKGGLGRFTRRRRWQRRAICSETLERIASAAPIIPPSDPPSTVTHTATPSINPISSIISAITPLKSQPTIATEVEIATAKRTSSLSPTRQGRASSITSIDRASHDREGSVSGISVASGSILGAQGTSGTARDVRQRLKMAMGNVGG